MPTKRSTSVEDFIIDFSKEEQGGGGGARYKPGTYPSRIIAAKPMTSQDKGTPGLEVTFQFTAGKLKGKKMVDTLWASPKAYSRFRTLLEACGKKVPQRVNLIRIAKAIKGAELYIEIDDEERDGYKTRSRVTFDGFISEEDYEADEDEDEEDDEAEDEEDDGDLEDEDEEEEDEDEEEEEEEPPAKRRRSRPKAKASTKSTATKRRKKAPADDDDLDDLDLDAL